MLSCPVAPVLTGQLGDRFRQRLFIGSMHRLVALCGTPLTDQPARVPFAHSVLLARVLNGRPTPLGA